MKQANTLRSNTRRSDALRSVLVEGLERRQLLAASLNGGVLNVVGTGNGETIVVSKDPKNAARILVQIGKQQTRFAASKVKSISVKGGAGNDKITVSDAQGALNVPITVDGEDGNDLITGGKSGEVLVGGNGNDTIVGGSGNDDVRGGVGNDVILAGGGNDKAQGEAGNDLIYGDAGDDSLFGGDGKDTLGGDDEDVLSPKARQRNDVVGDDLLDGGAGDDWLLGGTNNGDNLQDNNGADTMTGGAGKDVIDARGGGGDDEVTDKSSGDVVPLEDAPPVRELQGDAHTHVALILRVKKPGGGYTRLHIPVNVGIFNDSTDFRHLHTHAASNQAEGNKPAGSAVIHFESGTATSYTLKEFFNLWGISFSSNHIGRFYNAGKQKVKMEVRKQGSSRFTATTKFENYRPANGDIVQITFG